MFGKSVSAKEDPTISHDEVFMNPPHHRRSQEEG